VNAFKPHPRGFLAACEGWGWSPHEVVYVGDRCEVDAMGAAAAGMPCVIIGRDRHVDGAPFVGLRAFAGLTTALAHLEQSPRGITPAPAVGEQ
jgi:putative hydrolase of the HAD superfamily